MKELTLTLLFLVIFLSISISLVYATEIPTVLTQEAIPPSPQNFGIDVKFICRYITENGMPIEDANVMLFTDIGKIKMLYENGLYYARLSAVDVEGYYRGYYLLDGNDVYRYVVYPPLDPNKLNWNCEASKLGYQSQRGEKNSYTLMETPTKLIQKVEPPLQGDLPTFSCIYTTSDSISQPNLNLVFPKRGPNPVTITFKHTDRTGFNYYSYNYPGGMLKPGTYFWNCSGKEYGFQKQVSPIEEYTVIMRDPYNKIEDNIFDGNNSTRIYYPKSPNGKAVILLPGGTGYGKICYETPSSFVISMDISERHPHYTAFIDTIVNRGYTFLMPHSYGCLKDIGEYLDKVIDFTLNHISNNIILIGHSAGGSIGFYYITHRTSLPITNGILLNFPFWNLHPEDCVNIDKKTYLVFSADDSSTDYNAIEDCKSQNNPNVEIKVISPGYGHSPFDGENNEKIALPMFFWGQCPGDINRDGQVDIRDIATVAKAFGSYPGHSKWNPVADIDGNGIIDILDIAKVAKNFGKKC
ncbi:MAG: dockerin type I domain-containing protein [Candidatus Aenigmarchaeota archaeon]|nr:dockerin type I domain-containing protein [Candidatus Aenigmarchaeota archaeon]